MLGTGGGPQVVEQWAHSFGMLPELSTNFFHVGLLIGTDILGNTQVSIRRDTVITCQSLSTASPVGVQPLGFRERTWLERTWVPGATGGFPAMQIFVKTLTGKTITLDSRLSTVRVEKTRWCGPGDMCMLDSNVGGNFKELSSGDS